MASPGGGCRDRRGRGRKDERINRNLANNVYVCLIIYLICHTLGTYLDTRREKPKVEINVSRHREMEGRDCVCSSGRGKANKSNEVNNLS